MPILRPIRLQSKAEGYRANVAKASICPYPEGPSSAGCVRLPLRFPKQGGRYVGLWHRLNQEFYFVQTAFASACIQFVSAVRYRLNVRPLRLKNAHHKPRYRAWRQPVRHFLAARRTSGRPAFPAMPWPARHARDAAGRTVPILRQTHIARAFQDWFVPMRQECLRQ